MRWTAVLAGSAAIGLSLAAAPGTAQAYGCRCDGCSDDWGSGGRGYYAYGAYYSSYPYRHHYWRRHYGHRYHRYYRHHRRFYGYGGGYGYGGYRGG